MMNPKRHYSFNDLFDYVNHVLDLKEHQSIKYHVQKCAVCRKELKKALKLKLLLIHTKPLRAKDNLTDIVSEIKQRRLSYKISFYDCINSIREKIVFLTKLKPAYSFLLGLILIVSLSFYWIISVHDNIYLLKIKGDVSINHSEFFSLQKYKLNFNKFVHIEVKEGECALQINKEKLIIVKRDSEVVLNNKKNIYINLFQGDIVCSVRKKNKAKRLIVQAEGIQFKIVGTKFFVRNRNNQVELGVKEGKVQAFVRHNKLMIGKEKLLTIDNKKIDINTLSAKENKRFKDLAKIPFIQNSQDLQGMYITSQPNHSSLYINSEKVGETPISLLFSSKDQDITLYREGFLPEKINLGEKEQNRHFPLRRPSLPELIGKYKLPTNLYLRPLKMGRDLIIPGSDGLVYKLNLDTKKIDWQIKIPDKINVSPIHNDDNIYLATREGWFYAIDYNKGVIVWKKQVGTLVDTSPCFYKNRLYFGDNTGVLYSLNSIDGKIEWTMKFEEGFFSSPIVYKGILYIGNLDGVFYAIDIEKRKKVWFYQTGDKIVNSDPIIKDNLIFFGSNDAYLYAFNLTTEKLIWKYKTDSELFITPLILDNRIIIASSKGTIYGFNYKNGELLWKYRTYGGVFIKGTTMGNKYICFGDTKNNLYVLDKNGFTYLKFNYKFYNFITFDYNIFVIGENGLVYNFLMKGI